MIKHIWPDCLLVVKQLSKFCYRRHGVGGGGREAFCSQHLDEDILESGFVSEEIVCIVACF